MKKLLVIISLPFIFIACEKGKQLLPTLLIKRILLQQIANGNL